MRINFESDIKGAVPHDIHDLLRVHAAADQTCCAGVAKLMRIYIKVDGALIDGAMDFDCVRVNNLYQISSGIFKVILFVEREK